MQGKKECKALIETGSQYNFINESPARSLRLQTVELKNKTVELADGSSINIKEESKIDMQIQGDKNITYHIETKCMLNLLTVLILGL